ncbi:MAG: gliding motility-associated C-terminal domain-containing protein [Bacteroidales bacterium]|nr:gliding motility-associated C-terminal domain-containing protein [Bacteroidales bacterium]
MLKIYIIISSLLVLNFISFSQHESDYWYFGNYAGLDFSSGKPEPLINGQLKNYEGCAVASDSAGNLLFYTNGMTVWNKEHQIMENGEGLTGDTSSTQSAIIIPQPGNDNLYYIFTFDDFLNNKNSKYNTDGLKYSIADMTENSGLGKITAKNILLLDSVLEKNTAIYHQNGKDIWLIAHEWNNDKFYAWLISENGVSNTPVISSIGLFYNHELNSIGYMKISPNSQKIVVAVLLAKQYQVFDFNNLTGIISNVFTIPSVYSAYGCEFSPDASKLYMTGNRKLFQADMNAGTPADIINSVTEIAELNSDIGALQLAKNGKLYITSDTSNYLSVINYPDSFPAVCGFEQDAVYLEGRKARLGLPNFIQSYFKKPDLKYQNTCVFDETQFFIENLSNIDSVEWDFGDIESGSLNFSTELSPVHVFSNAGIFKVTLTIWFNNVSNEYSENIKIVALPELNLGNDTIFCYTGNYSLNAYSYHATYLWSDLSILPYLDISENGKYWVDIENIYTGCKNSDTINVVFSEAPEINLGNDTSFCENSSYFLNAYHPFCTYIWQDLSNESYFTAYSPGTYFVKVTNEDGCFNIDSIELAHKLIPRFEFPDDTTLCDGEVLLLSPNLNNDVNFLWQDGTDENFFQVTDSGFYKLNSENICGSWSDSINVYYRYCGDVFIPNIFTPTNDGINELFIIKGIEEGIWNLDIYNRWGQLVNRFNKYNNNWDGTDFFGRKLASTTYYYILTNPNIAEVYKGTVRIMYSD